MDDLNLAIDTAKALGESLGSDERKAVERLVLTEIKQSGYVTVGDLKILDGLKNRTDLTQRQKDAIALLTGDRSYVGKMNAQIAETFRRAFTFPKGVFNRISDTLKVPSLESPGVDTSQLINRVDPEVTLLSDILNVLELNNELLQFHNVLFRAYCRVYLSEYQDSPAGKEQLENDRLLLSSLVYDDDLGDVAES